MQKPFQVFPTGWSLKKTGTPRKVSSPNDFHTTTRESEGLRYADVVRGITRTRLGGRIAAPPLAHFANYY